MSPKTIPSFKRTNATVIPPSVAQAFVTTSTFAEEAQPPSSLRPVPDATEPQDVETPESVHAPSEGVTPVARKTQKNAAPGRKVHKRADGTEVRKVTTYLPAELERRLKLHCLNNGLDGSQVLTAALERYLRGKE